MLVGRDATDFGATGQTAGVLPVGVDGALLVADSTQPLGVKWASGVPIGTQTGTSQYVYNLWYSQTWELSAGTIAAPLTTPGPIFKVSRTERMNKAVANGNAVDNEANAAVAFYSSGDSASNMQVNALFAGATGAPFGTDVVAINGIGRATTGATGIGTGAYFEGRRDVTTAKLLGAEVRASNQAGASISYNPSGFSSGALWLTASGSNVGAGCSLGSAGAKFDVGYGASAGSVVTVTFRDDSSAVTSIQLNGAHTYGIDMTGATFSGAPLLAPLTTPASSSATGKQGAVVWDANFIYICTSTNTWKRATLATF